MVQLTPKQKAAVEDRDHDILISASAGSGKTTVLVERVLNELRHQVNVDQLLVITFTKAAANEMKTRIKSKLQELLNKKQSSFLRQQLVNVDTANISTIDAFCLDVIKRFYYVVDLDPSFSILTDETQAALLRERALRNVEADWLEKRPEEFKHLYGNFAGDREAEGARALLLAMYQEASTKPGGRDWLKHLAAAYDCPQGVSQAPIWQEQIKPYLLATGQAMLNELSQLLSDERWQEKGLAKSQEAIAAFQDELAAFLNMVQQDESYDQMRTQLTKCRFATVRPRGLSDDAKAFLKEVNQTKEDLKEQVTELYAAFFVVNEKRQKALLQKGAALVQTAAAMGADVIAEYGRLKRAQGLLDFADLEQFAYQILSGTETENLAARSFFQNKFKLILVDEYQDVNDLQDKLIGLLKTKSNHLFLVGDVKQSIYGFRQAKPQLFLAKFASFAKRKDARRLLLNENFRSSQTVVDTVNRLFNPLMTKDFGGIDYQNDGQLVYGAKHMADLPQATEVLTVKDDDAKKSGAEAELVIARIRQLQKENFQVYDKESGEIRPFKFSDIALLTRSRSGNLDLMKAFAQSGIPLQITDAENYFQTFELTVVLNFLRIIDNPAQDIPLVAVLRSPICNFSTEDLAQIRLGSPDSDFYTALAAYSTRANALAQKCQKFLHLLTELRDFAAQHRISELIWTIYEKTDLLEIMTSLPNGQQRRVNLESLYERASSFESAGFKGLYQFVNFIERMRKTQRDLAQPLLGSDSGNAVRLLTIHGAKGLEFPIVFYLGLTHGFQQKDQNADYLFAGDSLGLTLKARDFKIDSLVKAAANIEQKRASLEEESRILYVALTRAQQKLILVARLPRYQQTINSLNKPLNPLAAKMPLDFVGRCLPWHSELEHLVTDIGLALEQKPLVMATVKNESEQAQQVRTEKAPDQTSLRDTAQRLFSFKYPYADASVMPAYQSVSEIKRALTDPDEQDLANSHLVKSSNRYLQPLDEHPDFLFKTGFTGAELGTAAHLVLQYYPYDKPQADLSQEISSLIQQKKLTPALAAKIDRGAIEWFVHSDFAQPFYKQPERLHREVAFSSLIPASKLQANFSDQEAQVLLHGTIDGYFDEPDGELLFDYKTDYVDLKNEEASIAAIKKRYRVQLALYAQALAQFNGRLVDQAYLILLAARKCVRVNLN
jgi:ATP-dependent helicase/nuclease subunit A